MVKKQTEKQLKTTIEKAIGNSHIDNNKKIWNILEEIQESVQ